jgi:hypothetical protein
MGSLCGIQCLGLAIPEAIASDHVERVTRIELA